MKTDPRVCQADPVRDIRLISPFSVVLLITAQSRIPLFIVGEKGTGRRSVFFVIESGDYIRLKDHFIVLIDPEMLQGQVHFDVIAAETVIVVGIRGLGPPVDRFSFELFVVRDLLPELLRFVLLVDPVAVISFAGEHDLIAFVRCEGMLFVDRVHFISKFFHEFIDVIIPRRFIYVVISIVVR